MMERIYINDKISYIAATKAPLSADIGIIEGEKSVWIFDAGNCEEVLEAINSIQARRNIVISHFHPDHMGNLKKIKAEKIYLGKNTYDYANCGEVVEKDIYIDDGAKLHIFPLPSSHAKGSLGLEVDGEYAFLGDGIYSTVKNGKICYNSSVLKEEIAVLESLEAKWFLLSHDRKFVKSREEVLSELYGIYSKRDPKESYIFI